MTESKPADQVTCEGAGEGQGGVTQQQKETLIVGVLSQLYMYVKTLPSVCFKYLKFILQ